MRQDLYSLREIENFSKMNPERRIGYFKRVAAQALPFWGFKTCGLLEIRNRRSSAGDS